MGLPESFCVSVFFLKSWNNCGVASSSYKLAESGHSSCCRIKVIYQGTSAVANILSESEAFVWKPKRGGGVLSFWATKRSFMTQKKQTEQKNVPWDKFYYINNQSVWKNGKWNLRQMIQCLRENIPCPTNLLCDHIYKYSKIVIKNMMKSLMDPRAHPHLRPEARYEFPQMGNLPASAHLPCAFSVSVLWRWCLIISP